MEQVMLRLQHFTEFIEHACDICFILLYLCLYGCCLVFSFVWEGSQERGYVIGASIVREMHVVRTFTAFLTLLPQPMNHFIAYSDYLVDMTL